jgi:hypothetical protein
LSGKLNKSRLFSQRVALFVQFVCNVHQDIIKWFVGKVLVSTFGVLFSVNFYICMLELCKKKCEKHVCFVEGNVNLSFKTALHVLLEKSKIANLHAWVAAR